MTKQQERVELVNWFYDTFNEELVDLEIKMERYSKKQTEEQREAFEKSKRMFHKQRLPTPKGKRAN